MKTQAQLQWPLAPRKFGTAFRYQYVVSQAELEVPAFNRNDRLSWHLLTGQGLDVCELQDRDGRFAGYVMGIAVGPDGLLRGSANRLPLSLEQPDFWTAFEAYLVHVAGRYGFLLEAQGKTRFYCDPVGMIGAVYNREDRMLAASTLLAITDPVVPNPKFDFDIIREKGGKLSLFHTADARVRRLNPNHYLDLDDFTEHRHWPTTERFALDKGQEPATYDEIFARASFNLAEIARAYPVALPVSGGQDSRLLLSFASDHTDLIDRFYTHINNYATRRDAAIGKELCDALGVAHEEHDKRETEIARWQSNEFKLSWDLAFGVEAPMPMEYLNGVILNLPEGDVVLRGHQTDFLRAVFVFPPRNRRKQVRWQLSRMLIVPRDLFGPEIVKRFSEDFHAWEATLPECALTKAADFMFLEVYYNATIGATFPALWRNFYISPFNSRRLIELSLSFDDEFRRASLPVFDIIDRFCPALSGVPFDFELHPDLSRFFDPAHREGATAERVRATRDRADMFDKTAG